MNATTAHRPSTEAPQPIRRLITTRQDYGAAVDELIDRARRELLVFDPDAAQLDLNSPARIALIREFLRKDRTNALVLVVHSTDAIEQRCPRFLDLIALHGTQVRVQRTEGDAARAGGCFVIADEQHLVRRLVHEHPRGAFILNDPQDVALMRERFDQLLDGSTPALAATTLGL